MERSTNRLAAFPYASELIATDANTTRVDRRSSRAERNTGSAHPPSPSVRGGKASNTTSPTAGSVASASRAPRNISVSTAAWPVTSSGLFCEAKCGSTERNLRFVVGAKSGSVRPASPAASANSVHAPPDCNAAAIPVVRIVR